MKSQEILVTNDLDLNECYEKMLNALKGTNNGLQVTVKENIQKRSTLQNAFYWRGNNSISKFMKDAGCYFMLQGEKLEYTKDVVHMINKSHFGIDTTTKMSIREFVDYITALHVFWDERTNGFYVPSESVIIESKKWESIK